MHGGKERALTQLGICLLYTSVDHGQAAESPEIVEVLRRRENPVFLLHHAEDGKTGVDPAQERVLDVAFVKADHETALSRS